MIPELKLSLIVLAFMKLAFFIRIFEDYGFLVQMILYCIIDLIPFIMSFMIFLVVFSISFVVLRNEIDPDVNEVEGLSYFQKMLLQSFRTSIGELGMPTYTAILESEDSALKDTNITLIWIVWLVQIFF